jgi:imidazolonepropionase-like amidohydrolase
MRRLTMACTLVFGLLVSLVAELSAQDGNVTAKEEVLAVVSGTVHTMAGPPIPDGVVLVQGGKILAVGKAGELKVPEGARVLDAKGGWILPGFVELHNHTLGSDLHDNVFQVNPELRVLDNLTMDTPEAKIAVAGGVTCALVIPGSGSNMGGWGAIVKTFGTTTDEVIMKFPGALKVAQAGNPEQYDGDLGHGPIGMNWMIRNVLREGKRYHDAWEAFEGGKTEAKPERNLRYESMRGLFRKEYPCAVHTQMMQVVQSSMRILHDELGMDIVIDHGTFTGYHNAPEIAKRDIPVANGPRQFWYDRNEGRFIGLAAAWYWLGLGEDLIGINTDAPGVPQEELFYQAAWSVRMGLPETAALRGLTINAARMLKIEDRVGSLESGKDADVAVWTGDPLDPRSRTRFVLVNGKVAYHADRDGIRF